MTKKNISKEELAQFLLAWYLDLVKKKKEIVNEIGYKFSIFQPQKKIEFINELSMLYMFMVNRAIFDRFENNSGLGQQIVNLFFKHIFNKLPPETINSFKQKLQERTAQYDKVIGLEGGTMFASTFIGNVFGNPMSGMTFKAIPFQVKLLATLSALNKDLRAFDVN